MPTRLKGISSEEATPASTLLSVSGCRVEQVVLLEENEPKEWVAKVEPGVHITFVSMPRGGNDLKHIRFRLTDGIALITCCSSSTYGNCLKKRLLGLRFGRRCLAGICLCNSSVVTSICLYNSLTVVLTVKNDMTVKLILYAFLIFQFLYMQFFSYCS